MSRFVVDPNTAGDLKGKVVVLSGGSSGIGAATVALFHSQGCKVVFGDINPPAASEKLDDSVVYVKTDISDYDDVVRLFDTALRKFGKVDVAANIAALTEIGNWFDPDLTLDTVKRKAVTKLVDVNLLGSLYFARVAVVYLKENSTADEDKSLILISSVAGFKESPGLFVYQATKHGIIGLLRSLRKYPAVSSRIRVNAVCPWMTLTGMVAGIKDAWEEAKLPTNRPEDIAKIIFDIARANNLNGEAIYVEGGRGWAIECGIEKTEPIWLGAEQSRTLAAGQDVLGDGMDWTNREGGKE